MVGGCFPLGFRFVCGRFCGCVCVLASDMRFVCAVGLQSVPVKVQVLFPLRLLHDLCAGSNGDVLSAGRTWSAVQGSPVRAPCPHSQQIVAVALTRFASRL